MTVYRETFLAQSAMRRVRARCDGARDLMSLDEAASGMTDQRRAEFLGAEVSILRTAASDCEGLRKMRGMAEGLRWELARAARRARAVADECAAAARLLWPDDERQRPAEPMHFTDYLQHFGTVARHAGVSIREANASMNKLMRAMRGAGWPR